MKTTYVVDAIRKEMKKYFPGDYLHIPVFEFYSIGGVNVKHIDGLGFATTYDEDKSYFEEIPGPINSTLPTPQKLPIKQRPFGGYITIKGTIQSLFKNWKLYYIKDVPNQKVIDDISMSFDPADLTLLSTGTIPKFGDNLTRWDTWDNGNNTLNGLYTLILVGWDTFSNKFYCTQAIHINNLISGLYCEITEPTWLKDGLSMSKSQIGGNITLKGNANCNHFKSYSIRWVKNQATAGDWHGITNDQITQFEKANCYGFHTPVMNGKLGDWNISNLPTGSYCLQLEVIDKTLFSDGEVTQWADRIFYLFNLTG